MTGLEALDWLRRHPSRSEAVDEEEVALRHGGVHVRAALSMAHGEEWIVFFAEIGRGVDCGVALAYNATIAVGAVALLDDVFAVKHGLPLPRSVEADLAGALEIVAAEAASLRDCAPSLGDPDVFLHMAC